MVKTYGAQMSHNHDHTHNVTNYSKAFAFGIVLNLIYIFVEFIYGLIINSLALIADAGHNLSDVLGLILAWIASYLVSKSPTYKYTYGLKKSSILAAFLNALILLVAIGAIIWEAIGRFGNPQKIEGETVIIVAGVGVIINTITALLFFSGRKHDLNIKGAFLHMAADAGISLGVVIVGIVLLFTDYYWLDPVVSIIIGIIIFWGTWDLLKDSVSLALDAIPKNVDRVAIEKYISSLPEVEEFHDLHIWAMSTTENSLTVHLSVKDVNANDDLIKKISNKLEKDFNISHVTIQIEHKYSDECKQKSDEHI